MMPGAGNQGNAMRELQSRLNQGGVAAALRKPERPRKVIMTCITTGLTD